MNELSNAIINDFIKMTERVANGKTNVLDFGTAEMTFYRGIFISEMAHNFNNTRAVVAKTVKKLEKRGLRYMISLSPRVSWTLPKIT
jgi:DNA-binding MarR family transcriptional regulator